MCVWDAMVLCVFCRWLASYGADSIAIVVSSSVASLRNGILSQVIAEVKAAEAQAQAPARVSGERVSHMPRPATSTASKRLLFLFLFVLHFYVQRFHILRRLETVWIFDNFHTPSTNLQHGRRSRPARQNRRTPRADQPTQISAAAISLKSFPHAESHLRPTRQRSLGNTRSRRSCAVSLSSRKPRLGSR